MVQSSADAGLTTILFVPLDDQRCARHFPEDVSVLSASQWQTTKIIPLEIVPIGEQRLSPVKKRRCSEWGRSTRQIVLAWNAWEAKTAVVRDHDGARWKDGVSDGRINHRFLVVRKEDRGAC